MSNEIIINVTSKEKRVAFIEDGAVSELYYQREKETGYVGNIYKGKVQRVLPGMQAAFVELGLEKAAFLYTADVGKEYADLDTSDDDNGDSKPQKRFDYNASIEKKLSPGQNILVQVVRGPIGTKGARITSHISLPGRYVVYMPSWNKIGVSRKIVDDNERRRLRRLIRQADLPYGGFIVRTAAEGVDDEEITNDVQLLKDEWASIYEKMKTVKAPALVQTEVDAVLKALRDLLSFGIDKIVIDDEEECARIQKFIDRYIPSWHGTVDYYSDDIPVFDYFGVEAEINRALGKKVWLKSGGYLIIEQTEALITIDVNTGRFVGKTSLEDTIVKTNITRPRTTTHTHQDSIIDML
jgi:ribonuclease G